MTLFSEKPGFRLDRVLSPPEHAKSVFNEEQEEHIEAK